MGKNKDGIEQPFMYNSKNYINNWDFIFGRKCLKCKEKFIPEKDEEFCFKCAKNFIDG